MRGPHKIMFEYFRKSCKHFIKTLIKGKSDDDNHFENPYLIL